MTYTPVYTQALDECRDTLLAGGKAANLGRLIRAGFPVPTGFVITTRAYRVAQRHVVAQDNPCEARSPESPGSIPAELPAAVADEIRWAYRAMGGGPVAVRSSATAEDTVAASMAGQYETFLNIEGEAPLLDAVRRCWLSLHSPRTRAYLHEQGLDPSGVAMAVVVQRLVSAEVAGVLFTTNPHPHGQHEMLVEASWGLGEAVVSGQVQPDTLRLDQATGRVLAAIIADKHLQVTAGAHDDGRVDPARRRQPCLRGRDVHRLWELGRRAAAHFGTPQDIEWALHAGALFVVQTRPITTLRDAEAYEEVLRSTRQQLRGELAAGRGPWVLHNLAETLPHPTPLTWSILRRFMSGSGGFGAMYRQAGFAPSPTVDREGFLDVIAGRIYMDASRAPEMFFEDFPFAYDLVELQRSPDASQTPPTLPRGSLFARLKAARRLATATAKLRACAVDFDRQLHDTFFPDLARYVADAKRMDLAALSAGHFVDCWQTHERQVLDSFGPQSLLPSLISAMALAELRALLAEQFWDEDPDALALLISSGGPPDRTVSGDAELYEVGQGQRSLETWLAAHGHRASGEFDLAAPRWREQPEAVLEMAARLAAGASPRERHHHQAEAVQRRMQTLRARLSRGDRRALDRCVEFVRRYVVFREDAKDVLMLGYDLLRDLALEAGRRLDVGQDVFYLTRDDLFDALRVGFAPYHLIEQRKVAYRTELRLQLPRVIDPQRLDVLGAMPEKEPTAGGHRAFAVSSGEASGPARILAAPAAAGDLGRGYILVCPSTDPSWTPLFVNAAGLVLERGGSLSHGAVVAREMGLPAVVLPDAAQLFREGAELRVDGDRGWVGPNSAASRSTAASAAVDPDDVHVLRELVPPPPGSRDWRGAKLRNVLALMWAAYLLAVFLAPERWAYQPTLSALDFLFWPLVRAWGKPATVALLAVGLASLALIVQKLVTDNRRLREAKRRAAALQRLANSLPQDSLRRSTLLRLATPVQLRTLLAALAPIGILLGPMVLPFLWFTQRIDPAVWNAPVGAAVQVVALVESDWREPLRIEVPSPVAVDAATPAERTLPPLRETLERLLTLYRQPRSDPNAPWELQAAPDLAREQTASDLQAYLAAGIPPQGITWLIRPPDDMSGPFSVAVTTPGHPPVTVRVVLGEEYPPAPRNTQPASDSPVKEVRVVYPKSRIEPVFWRPLASLVGDHPGVFLTWLATLDIGWLWLYILAYLPALLLVRAILRVA